LFIIIWFNICGRGR